MEKEHDDMLNQVHVELLGILSYIHETLEKEDLWYSLGCGTVLGAVRENGFIEWDKDADIYIKLHDRDKIRKALKKNLPEVYVYVDASKDNVACFDNIMSKNYGTLAAVDIYPLIGAPAIEQWDQKKIDRLMFRNMVLVKLTCAKYEDYRKLGKKYKIVPFLLVKGMLHLIPNRLIRRIVRKREEEYDYDAADRCYAIVSYLRPSEILRKEIYEKVELHSFEGKQFYIPSDYDTYLKARYGATYMTPSRKNNSSFKIKKHSY